MTADQLRLLRERARVGEATELLDVAEAAGVLLRAGWREERVATLLRVPTQGNVTPGERLKEMLLVDSFLTDRLRIVARLTNAPWHGLVEPARWYAAGELHRQGFEAFIGEFYQRTESWPKVDTVRRHYGKAGTRRLPGDDPNQGALEVTPVDAGAAVARGPRS